MFENRALADARRGRVVVTGAEEIAEHFIFAGEGAQFGEGGGLAEGGGDVERAAADVRRDGGIDERIDRRVAEQREHRGRLGGVVAGVAASEGVGRSEKSGGRRHL